MSPRPNSDGRRPARGGLIHALPAEGAVRLPDGQRAAVLPGVFFRYLSAELGPPPADGTRHSLYKFGYEWSLQEMVRLSRQLGEEFGGGANLDLWQMDAKFVLDRWWAPFGATGWGAWTLDLSSLTRGFAFVELRQSVVAPQFAGTTQPCCHLYAGLFAGALSFFERLERHAVEFQCAATGAPTCRFVVGPAPQVDEAESWRRQRVAPDEIRRRLS
ncbi:MAG: 4-vinyl reductase [Verrucomicrobia bacterium]|nr:4-vinyl reductase [Verrucomicrobiota bacterium]